MKNTQNILFVCLGNICRSPMAEYVFRHKVQAAGLADWITVDSAGTSGYHDGEGMHRGTAAVLRAKGIDHSEFISSRVRPADADKFDLFIVMDDSNLANLKQIVPLRDGQAFKLTDLIPESGYTHVPDPYYTGDFEETFRLVDAAADALLNKLKMAD
ncbi:low molecular weight protein-tyrosine-phosphatase [Neisseria sp. 83E34]|uniref:low molecular weight protein-tyrosine-phosphatase n=1 Tax=Neisseria sp. 83E34 TaxID=1692264 RepID=UPI0006CEA770|nr:low molecular weight protein-tyrosine-phosphatase [Neisseria sp. 83E34]KPN71863.1 protein tyrosine phosphatase [Neisseria sp. 83E34]